MTNAQRRLHMRARLNSDRLDGPHIFHTDDQLTDTFLIDWAKANVFNQ
jgi:UDP-galactopyranose mutase